MESATFTDCTFEKNMDVGSYGYNFLRPYTNTTLEGCTFGKEFKLGGGASGKTYIVNNCTYGGTRLTSENAQELLLDMTGEDGTYIRSCTIIIDGVTVTLH